MNKCGGDEMMMAQEYPCNDIEAFVASGRPVFDTKICLQNYELSKRAKPRIGNLV